MSLLVGDTSARIITKCICLYFAVLIVVNVLVKGIVMKVNYIGRTISKERAKGSSTLDYGLG